MAEARRVNSEGSGGGAGSSDDQAAAEKKAERQSTQAAWSSSISYNLSSVIPEGAHVTKAIKLSGNRLAVIIDFTKPDGRKDLQFLIFDVSNPDRPKTHGALDLKTKDPAHDYYVLASTELLELSNGSLVGYVTVVAIHGKQDKALLDLRGTSIVYCWNPLTLQIMQHAGHLITIVTPIVEASPNTVIYGTAHDEIVEWNFTKKEQPKLLHKFDDRGLGIKSLTALPNKLLVAEIKIFPAFYILNLNASCNPDNKVSPPQMKSEYGICCIAACSNGDVAIGDTAGKLIILDATTYNVKKTIPSSDPNYAAPFRSLVALPNQQLISSHDGTRFQFWNIEQGIHTLFPMASLSASITIEPNGDLFVSQPGSRDDVFFHSLTLTCMQEVFKNSAAQAVNNLNRFFTRALLPDKQFPQDLLNIIRDYASHPEYETEILVGDIERKCKELLPACSVDAKRIIDALLITLAPESPTEKAKENLLAFSALYLQHRDFLIATYANSSVITRIWDAGTRLFSAARREPSAEEQFVTAIDALLLQNQQRMLNRNQSPPDTGAAAATPANK